MSKIATNKYITLKVIEAKGKIHKRLAFDGYFEMDVTIRKRDIVSVLSYKDYIELGGHYHIIADTIDELERLKPKSVINLSVDGELRVLVSPSYIGSITPEL